MSEIHLEKQCNKCDSLLPASSEHFFRDRSKNDGLMNTCKACWSAHRKQRYQEKRDEVIERSKQYYQKNKAARQAYQKKYRAENRDAVLEQHKQYYQENRGAASKYRKQYYQENIDAASEYQKRYRRENPDAVKERELQWRKANPEKTRAHDQRRRARKAKAQGTHTAADIRKLYKQSKGRCWWCGKKIRKEYHVDHVVPLVRGGKNSPDNLCISCPKCNLSKGSKLPQEFNGRLF